MIINLGCASVDNHIPRDDIFDYHPRRECNIYIISLLLKQDFLSYFSYILNVFTIVFSNL